MDERAIMIADRDAGYRSQVANLFRGKGYRVEITGSAAHLVRSVLEKQAPVLLLGGDFDQEVCSADLIHLLKECNRHLQVIMVCDEMPLAQLRRVRQEGVFYYALKPAALDDTEELGMAVDCAFGKNLSSVQMAREQAQQRQAVLTDAGVGKPRPVKGELTVSIPRMIGLISLVFGMSYLALMATGGGKNTSSMAIWMWLGFCALIVTTQVLPIFRIKLPTSLPNRNAVKSDALFPEKK
jgi:FixJ family two-component response regulator